MVVNTRTEAKTQLSALVDRAAGGEEIIISKAVAVLVPYTRATGVRRPGRFRGRSRIADYFDTLPEDIADAFGARER